MRCKGKFINLFAILIVGLVAFNFCYLGANEAVNPKSAHYIPSCESLRANHSLLDLRECVPSNEGQSSEPLAYLFQILFILFIISPPLIVFMLFLIWRELKVGNSMK